MKLWPGASPLTRLVTSVTRRLGFVTAIDVVLVLQLSVSSDSLTALVSSAHDEALEHLLVECWLYRGLMLGVILPAAIIVSYFGTRRPHLGTL